MSDDQHDKHLPHEELGPVRKSAFLEEFAKSANVSASARVAGVSRHTYYDWRGADEEFKLAADDLKAAVVDRARQEILERALGVKTQVVLHRGEVVWKRHPITGAVLLDDDFEPIPLELPVNCPQSLFRFLEANAQEYAAAKGGIVVGVGAPGEGREDVAATINVSYVMPEGQRPEDDGGGDG